MNRAFEIRLYPTNEQKVQIDKTFGVCRFVYNNVLNLKQSFYKNYGFKDKDLNIVETLKAFYPWIREVGGQAICQSLNDLEKAYKNWFKSLSGKSQLKYKAPKFKKKNNKQSYRDNMMKKDIFKLLNIETRKITIPKIGKVSYRCGYDFSIYNIVKVCNITIKKSKTNKYFCSICCECDELTKLKENNYSIGFDLGLKDFLIDSEGCVIDNPKYFRKSQDKLTKEQRKLSHCLKGSKNKEKQKLKLLKFMRKL